MSDLIERQAAIDALNKMLHDCFWADDEELDAVITTLNELPSAQPERKNGKWLDGSIPTYAICNVCAYQERYAYENNFCPNCGADMRGDNDGSD